MNTFSFISHYLYRCSNRGAYLLRRLFLIGCISFTFILLISEANLTSGEASRIGLDVFHYVSLALYTFVILFVPVFASKLINDDKQQGVLPLLVISKISSSSLIWYKYTSFLALIAIHGGATLPVFLMCTHLGGVAAPQIFAIYLILFSFCSVICAAIICITCRTNFSTMNSLFATALAVGLIETLALVWDIPIAPAYQIDGLLNNVYITEYYTFFFVCIAMSLFFLLLAGRSFQVFSQQKSKRIEKIVKWLLKRYRFTKHFSRNNVLLNREEQRQIFQVTYAFCRFISVLTIVAWIPFLNCLGLIIVGVCALCALTVYASSSFAVDGQEIELLRLTRVTSIMILDNKRRALWLAIKPLELYVRVYIISGIIFLLILIGVYLCIVGVVVGICYGLSSFMLVRIALYCSAKYRSTATALTYTIVIFLTYSTCISFIFAFLMIFAESLFLVHCLICLAIILYSGKFLTYMTLREIECWLANKNSLGI
ncbi:hypothetical protein [Candidatus Uabimicrobium sp. HlEnr_7]|uniref:hypothetical protein n=1 Tax=Candidatus Uabimicrobium helgolandensis TaxID=3095367 RepID=UPI0035591BE5